MKHENNGSYSNTSWPWTKWVSLLIYWHYNREIFQAIQEDHCRQSHYSLFQGPMFSNCVSLGFSCSCWVENQQQVIDAFLHFSIGCRMHTFMVDFTYNFNYGLMSNMWTLNRAFKWEHKNGGAGKLMCGNGSDSSIVFVIFHTVIGNQLCSFAGVEIIFKQYSLFFYCLAYCYVV
jgi:hypothetical protein